MFGTPFDQPVPGPPLVRRWSGPLRYRIDDPPSADAVRAIEAAVAEVSDLTGRASQRVADGASAPIRFVFETGESFVVRDQLAACYVLTRRDPPEAIVDASIHLDAGKPDRIAECARHELMHALGFLYHSGLGPSVLSPFHDQSTFSDWDEAAIRMLFSPRVRPGMTREAALAAVRDLIGKGVVE
jgi:hypothetical protein